jgi:multidrug efflux pump subunit AcrB
MAMLHWSLAHRLVVVGITGLVLLSTIPLFMKVNKNFLPTDDEAQFELNFRAPEGTSLEATQLIGNRIARDVRALDGVTSTVLTIGGDSKRTPNYGSLYVKLVDARKRKEPQSKVMDRVRKEVLTKYQAENLRADVSMVNAFQSGAKEAEILFVVND